MVINKMNHEGLRVDIEQNEKLKKGLPSPQLKSYAFTLRKFIKTDPKNNNSEIEIESLPLWDLLKNLLAAYPYHIYRGNPQTLGSPYEAMITNWDRLVKASEDTTIDGYVRESLRALLDAISNGSGDPQLDENFKNRAANKEQNLTTFQTLWTLFPPGCLVYGKIFQGQDELFIVEDNTRA